MNGLNINLKLTKNGKSNRVQLVDNLKQEFSEKPISIINDAVISGETITCKNSLKQNCSARTPSSTPNYFEATEGTDLIPDSELLPNSFKVSQAFDDQKAAETSKILCSMINNRKTATKLDYNAAIQCLNGNSEIIPDFGLRMLRGMGYDSTKEDT